MKITHFITCLFSEMPSLGCHQHRSWGTSYLPQLIDQLAIAFSSFEIRKKK